MIYPLSLSLSPKNVFHILSHHDKFYKSLKLQDFLVSLKCVLSHSTRSWLLSSTYEVENSPPEVQKITRIIFRKG
jgi:hypothetical protein